VNRRERRAAKLPTEQRAQRLKEHIDHNVSHWGEIRRIKREYDALSEAEKAERKPALAAQIDYHLAVLKAA
jgi:hypothetical protein